MKIMFFVKFCIFAIIVCYNRNIMEGNKTKPHAILVFGAPCSGKSTFAENFADKYSLAYYDLSQIKEDGKFSHKDLMTIIDLLARTKQNLVFEGEIDTEKERDEIRSVLRKAGYEPSLVWVQTDAATIRSRMKMKYKSISKAKEEYNRAVDALEAPSEIERAIILSGKHTFATQTKHVIAGLADFKANDRKRQRIW